jgi:hypothetical protein
MQQRLPTVPEQGEQRLGVLSNAERSRAGGDAVGRRTHELAPWQSPAVLELAQQVGRRRPEATPMVVEGPVGTVLAAVGEQSDHSVAGRALGHAMAQPKLCAPPTALGGGTKVQRQVHGGAIASSGGGRLAVGNNTTRHGASFGAVYEYRDGAGRPHFVAGTSAQPEAACMRGRPNACLGMRGANERMP